jgi:hypothetical protein
MFGFINENGIGRTVNEMSEMFEVMNKGHKTLGTAPLYRETSDRV